MSTDLSQRLRAARIAITPEITQRDVAKRLEKSPSAINLWEKGKTEPSASDLASLCQWYHVSADWLLGVEVKTPHVTIFKKDSANVYTVPIVKPNDMVRWTLDSATDVLQTTKQYPPQTAAAMPVSTDALSASCPSGGWAVISKAHKAEPGHIVLASVGKSDEPVLRKLVSEGSSGLLIADDVRYPSYPLGDGVKIIGRVVEYIIRRTLA